MGCPHWSPSSRSWTFHTWEAQPLGLCQSQSKSQKVAKEPLPSDEGGTLRRGGGGTCVPQGWLEWSWARWHKVSTKVLTVPRAPLHCTGHFRALLPSGRPCI